MKIRPLQPGDLQEIRHHALEKGAKFYPDVAPGPVAFACEHEGRLIGAGGLRIYWRGVAEAWIMLIDDFDSDLSTKIVLTIRSKLNELIADNELVRVQAYVRVGWEKAIKLIEFMGFEYEGTMRKYAPDGTDMMIYAKVK